MDARKIAVGLQIGTQPHSEPLSCSPWLPG
jgi:hypothetical protein